MASDLSRRLGMAPKMVEGRRITDADTLEVVAMVYAGLLNKRLVAALQALGVNALGLSGADGNAVLARKRQHPTIDFGFVGDVETVNVGLFEGLMQGGLVPVCCAITHDGQGNLLNTNADTIASRLATAMAARVPVSLRYAFDRPGVLADPTRDDSVIARIDRESYQAYRLDGSISDGMIPKLDNAFAALDAGVASVWIGNTLITA
jgi:acetylglutamate kinase